MSRLLFWLRRFRMAAQGWRPQRLVRICLISPSISLAEVCRLLSVGQRLMVFLDACAQDSGTSTVSLVKGHTCG
jgi:hypothetical protein